MYAMVQRSEGIHWEAAKDGRDSFIVETIHIDSATIGADDMDGHTVSLRRPFR